MSATIAVSLSSWPHTDTHTIAMSTEIRGVHTHASIQPTDRRLLKKDSHPVKVKTRELLGSSSIYDNRLAST